MSRKQDIKTRIKLALLDCGSHIDDIPDLMYHHRNKSADELETVLENVRRLNRDKKMIDSI